MAGGWTRAAIFAAVIVITFTADVTRGEVVPSSGEDDEHFGLDLVTSPGSGEEVAEEAVADEAAMMVAQLFGENRALRGRLVELEDQVADLQQKLAEALAGLDAARVQAIGKIAEQPAAPVEPGVAVEDIARMRVLDVNRDMQVAVVSGGSRAGMKPGMRFYVLREDRMIAQLMLVDVREQVAGGLIERAEKGEFPEKGDRLILSSKQDR